MFYDPFIAMEYVYDHTTMPGDPAYADLDEATKSALLDLAIDSPEHTRPPPPSSTPPTSHLTCDSHHTRSRRELLAKNRFNND